MYPAHTKFHTLSTIALSLLMVLLFPPRLTAQFDTASVLGTIRDESGAVLAGATVTLTNQGTGISATTQTDENGNYEFLTVKIGAYKIEASLASFSTARLENVRVTVGARQRVDLTMKVGEVTTTIEVSASAALLVEADTSDRGQVINQRQIVELPLNGRNYSDLALLTTGVRRSAYAFANPPREGSFNVNGQRSIFNNFLMDGVDNNGYGTSNQGFSSQVVQATPDALAEFKVVTSVMSAEFGRSSGAVINASIKSGTNEFHGSVWEFLRNTSLNAAGYFPPRTGKPVFQRNQFGLTFGGPIVKNRAFFFTNWEGFRERQKFAVFSNLPTVNERQGIFTVDVRNPLTGEVFPRGTAIPQDRMTSFARRVLADLPLPNTGSPNSPANNFQNLRADKNNNDKIDLKLDGQLTGKMTAFVRLSHRKSNILQAPDIPGPSGGGGNGFIRALNQQLATGVTFAASPTSLLEARFGFSKTIAGKEPPGLGGPSMLQLYGIPGLTEDPRLTGGLTNQNVAGYSLFGRQATNPQWQYPYVYNPKVNYSRILGKHSLKTGYEYQRIHTEIQDVNPLYGNDIYSGNFTGHNLADFMFGLRNSYSLVNFYIAQYRQVMNYAYLQDDWKVSSKLTLNLGVRYEYATPQWERDNRLTNFDPTSNRLILATDGSIADRSQVNPDRNNWAPRFGFAYSFNPRTVVRGGYGVSYVHFNRAGGGNILGINGPQVVTAAISQGPTTPGFRTTQEGYPVGLTDPDKFNPILANISYIPRDTRTGYVQNWALSIQREILGGTIVDIGYVGNKSTNLIVFADYNEARPNRPGENSSIQARRPNQAFGAITVTWPGGFANYHALQAKLERRFMGGLYLLDSFVYSKGIDNTGQALEDQGNGGRASPQSFYNLAAEKGVSDFDQTFNNTTSVVYELPFGKGRKYLSGGGALTDHVLGGWQLTLINNMWSGEPINLSYNPAANFQVSVASIPDWRGGISYRPNVIGPVVPPSDQRNVDTNFLDRSKVIAPTDPSQPFGNAGRNIARGFAFYQTDFGLSKAFALPRESMSLQFRAEAFNLFNKTNFRQTDRAFSNISDARFGQIRGTYPARQIQFALRLVF